MRTVILLVPAMCAALALASLACLGQAHAQSAPATLLLAQNDKPPRDRHRPAEQGPIACGKGGCHRIPAGCYPQMTFDNFGNPTGYEIAVCPGRR
jgi:hypothetical protein